MKFIKVTPNLDTDEIIIMNDTYENISTQIGTKNISQYYYGKYMVYFDNENRNYDNIHTFSGTVLFTIDKENKKYMQEDLTLEDLQIIITSLNHLRKIVFTMDKDIFCENLISIYEKYIKPTKKINALDTILDKTSDYMYKNIDTIEFKDFLFILFFRRLLNR